MEEEIKRAAAGDREALEALLLRVRDTVFNLSLRMLGTVHDAEDAAQEILIRVMTGLGGFRGESAFETWVYRIAVNHLKDYKKSMFAQRPLSFEYYGADIAGGQAADAPDPYGEADRALLAEELKYACTNVMLQCLAPEERCIFVLGTMFKADSRLAGEALGLTPEAYRQRLCRVRKKVAEFLDAYCGLSGKGVCTCAKRVGYAVQQGRLRPGAPEYTVLEALEPERLMGCKTAMERLDELSLAFEGLPAYKAPGDGRRLVAELLDTAPFRAVKEA